MRDATKWYDELELGYLFMEASHTFTEDEIIAFAKAYDPSPLHTDPAAAKAGPWGGLTASLNHIGAVWMQLMLKDRDKVIDRAAGPSPGIPYMKMLAPVRPGDTITFRTTLSEKIDMKSRPDWGIARNMTHATNQDGKVVLEFLGQGMRRKKPADEA